MTYCRVGNVFFQSLREPPVSGSAMETNIPWLDHQDQAWSCSCQQLSFQISCREDSSPRQSPCFLYDALSLYSAKKEYQESIHILMYVYTYPYQCIYILIHTHTHTSLSVCMCMGVCASQLMCRDESTTCRRIFSLLSLCGSLGLNSGSQVWQHAILLTEPSYQPRLKVVNWFVSRCSCFREVCNYYLIILPHYSSDVFKNLCCRNSCGVSSTQCAVAPGQKPIPSSSPSG